MQIGRHHANVVVTGFRRRPSDRWRLVPVTVSRRQVCPSPSPLSSPHFSHIVSQMPSLKLVYIELGSSYPSIHRLCCNAIHIFRSCALSLRTAIITHAPFPLSSFRVHPPCLFCAFSLRHPLWLAPSIPSPRFPPLSPRPSMPTIDRRPSRVGSGGNPSQCFAGRRSSLSVFRPSFH